MRGKAPGPPTGREVPWVPVHTCHFLAVRSWPGHFTDTPSPHLHIGQWSPISAWGAGVRGETAEGDGEGCTAPALVHRPVFVWRVHEAFKRAFA